MKLLIIEDDERLSRPLAKGLEKKGFLTEIADNGKTGLNMALVNPYDCIILDLNLPTMDGLTVARELRQENIITPILMLTARSLQSDKIDGFKSGTDDYLTKPFDLEELVYRINALTRRNIKSVDSILKYKNISLNTQSRKATVDGKEVHLSTKEFCVLEYLMCNIGKVVSTEELLEHVWDTNADLFTETVKTTIKTLRKKVDPHKDIIQTIKNAGYIIESN